MERSNIKPNYTVVLPAGVWSITEHQQLCTRRVVDRQNKVSTKTKHNEWILFATNVHSVSKLNREQRTLVEACLHSHMHQKAEEIIRCVPRRVAHQSL